jgi:thiopurine S-methyltransferase
LGHRYRLAYDRAALIALPTAMRQDYADLMARLMVAGGEVLLITLEYQPEQQEQPPFSVGELAVRALFERTFMVEVLGRRSEQDHPRVMAGQLSYFDEVAYRLTRRG